MNIFLQEYRCKCGKLLFKGFLISSKVEIKCKRCGIINVISGIDNLDDDNSFVLLVDRDGNIVNASESAVDILGYSAQEFSKMTIFDIHPNFPINIKEDSDDFTIKTYNKRKDEKLIPVVTRLKKFKLEEKEYFLIIVHSSVRGEADFDKSPENVKYACDFVSECNKNGIYTFFDPKQENILGYGQGEILGQSIFSFCDKKETEKQKEIFNKFVDTECPYKITKNLVNKKGVLVPIEAQMVPNYNDLGKFKGYYIINNLILNKKSAIKVS